MHRIGLTASGAVCPRWQPQRVATVELIEERCAPTSVTLFAQKVEIERVGDERVRTETACPNCAGPGQRLIGPTSDAPPQMPSGLGRRDLGDGEDDSSIREPTCVHPDRQLGPAAIASLKQRLCVWRRCSRRPSRFAH